MKEEEVLLSICIGTYNRRELLLKNLNNLKSISNDNIEIVVVDNASDDGTWEAISSLADDRFSLYRNNVNNGSSFNVVRALVLGKGKYRILLNDRDTLDRDKLHDFIDFLKSKKEMPDIIVASERMQGEKLYNNAKMRAFFYTKYTHPGTYIYSESVMKRVASILDEDILNGIKAFDEVSYNILLFLNKTVWNYEEWLFYPQQLTIVLPLKERKMIKQERKDPVHGDPWFAPEVRVKYIEEQTIMCKEIEKLDLWSGFYRANIEVILETYFNVAITEITNWGYWLKLPIVFMDEVRQILMKQDVYALLKSELRYETIRSYYLLFRQIFNYIFQKYIGR